MFCYYVVVMVVCWSIAGSGLGSNVLWWRGAFSSFFEKKVVTYLLFRIF